MTTAVLSPLAVASIRLYQRYISPYKGFRCAHRALTAKWSCSEYGRRVFAKHSITTAQALLKRRFAACRRSYESYLANRKAALVMAAATQTENEADRDKGVRRENACDCGVFACDVSHLLRGGASAGECATGDCIGIGACL